MKAISLRFRIYITLLISVFLIGMIGLTVFEHFTPLDAFYFVVVTISTVGYGDLSPLTPYGKILSIIIILIGVGCFVGLVANSIEYLIVKRERSDRLEKLNMIVGVFYSQIGTKLLRRFRYLRTRRSMKSVQRWWFPITGQTMILPEHLTSLNIIHTILTVGKSLWENCRSSSCSTRV